MARKKLVHIHSNVLNKMPKPADLNVGELAVNNNVGNEFISLKNSDNNVVRFSSDDQLVNWMNQKEVFPVSGEVEASLDANTSVLRIDNNQFADSATTGADKVNLYKGIRIDTSVFALSGGNVVFETINGNDASSLGNITNITYTPNNEIEEGVSGNTLEFAQSGNNNTVSVNLVFDDDLNSESVNAVQNKVLNDVLEEMEEVTAAALNDLNDRVLELENTPDLHVTGGRFSEGTLYIEQENGPTIEIGGISTGEGADGNNYPTSLSLSSNNVLSLGRNGMSNLTADLSSLAGGNAPTSGLVEKGTGADSGKTYINFYKDSTKLFGIDADALMIDGMVESVSISDDDNLVVTWNTDAGKEVTRIPLSRIFNPDNYYTKNEINHSLGEWFSPITNVSSSVTDAISGMQSTITNIDNRVNTISGDTISGGSVAGTTLVLNKTNGSRIEIPGLPTPGSVQKDGVVSGGSINQTNGNILLSRTEGLPDVSISGLSGFVETLVTSKGYKTTDHYLDSGVVINDNISGYTKGTILLTVSNHDPNRPFGINVPVSGLPEYLSGIEWPYLPLSGGTVSGLTRFTEKVTVENTITAENGFVHSGIEGVTDDDFDELNEYVLLAGGGYTALSSITPTDVWVNESGDTMTGELTFEDKTGSGATNLGLTYESETNKLELHTNGIIQSDALISSNGGFVNIAINDNNRDNYVLLGGGGYKALSEIAPTDVWVNESGDTMTGNLEFVDGSNERTMLINASQGNVIAQGSIGSSKGISARSGFTTTDGDYTTTNGSVFAREGSIEGKTVIVGKEGSGAANAHLDVYGNVNVYYSHDNTSDLVLNVNPYASNGESVLSVSGDVTATGAMYSSDKRLKENIESVSTEDLDNIKNIDFKAFNFVSNKTSQKIGVIAQELQDNGLGKLTGVNDAGYLTVDYISLLCLKIAELEKEIKELKSNKA